MNVRPLVLILLALLGVLFVRPAMANDDCPPIDTWTPGSYVYKNNNQMTIMFNDGHTDKPVTSDRATFRDPEGLQYRMKLAGIHGSLSQIRRLVDWNRSRGLTEVAVVGGQVKTIRISLGQLSNRLSADEKKAEAFRKGQKKFNDQTSANLKHIADHVKKVGEACSNNSTQITSLKTQVTNLKNSCDQMKHQQDNDEKATSWHTLALVILVISLVLAGFTLITLAIRS